MKETDRDVYLFGGEYCSECIYNVYSIIVVDLSCLELCCGVVYQLVFYSKFDGLSLSVCC